MIEIKGIQYEEIPKPEPKRMSKAGIELMILAGMYYTPFMGNRTSSQKGKLNVDIIKEFELIQDKNIFNHTSASELAKQTENE